MLCLPMPSHPKLILAYHITLHDLLPQQYNIDPVHTTSLPQAEASDLVAAWQRGLPKGMSFILLY